MLVKDLMKTRIITVSPEEPIEIAAREMARFGISCLLVRDESRIVGVITERDLLTRVIASGRDPKGLCVGDVMTTRLISVCPSTSIDEASSLMMDNLADGHSGIQATGHNPVRGCEGTETRNQRPTGPG